MGICYLFGLGGEFWIQLAKNFEFFKILLCCIVKIFLYAVYLQCFSRKSQANHIEPYLVESDLCTNDQYDWWFIFMFAKYNTHKTKGYKLNPKQETKLNSTIEILRLNRNKSKYMNFQICVKIALYLQNKYKLEKYQTVAIIDEKLLNDQHNQFEYLSPFEKSQLIFVYLVHYWSYIANYINGTRKSSDEHNFNADMSFNSSISSSYSLNTSTTANNNSLKCFFDFLNVAQMDNMFAFEFSDASFSKYIYENSLVYLAHKKWEDGNFKAVNDILSMIECDEQLLLDNFEVIII
jgi:hypothetical protein